MNEAAYRFADPWFLCALIIPLWVLFRAQKTGGAAFGAYSIARIALRPSRGPLFFRWGMAIALTLLTVALARPQFGKSTQEYTMEGRDLMMLIDLSGSMQVDDMENEQGERIDRLRAVMHAAEIFIKGRPNDRLGLAFFAEHALTSCPLTYDHATLFDFLTRTEEQMRLLWKKDSGLLGQGTNIGLGLGTSLRRLGALDDDKKKEESATNATAPDEEKEEAGRAIILITDGRDSRNLRNWVDPLEAARHARSRDIHIHAIGVGNPKGTRTTTDILGRTRLAPIGADFLPDMSRLHTICNLTDGMAMQAGNREELESVFEKVNELEPSPQSVRVREDYSDRYFWPLLCGSILLILLLIGEPRFRGVAA